MFAWLTDVFASSGFVVGEAWAFRRNQQWQELRIALATWWLVRAAKAPFLWCSAWLARHGKVGVWSRRVWVVVGLLLCGYFGPGPVLGLVPWPMPGVIGWLAGLGLIAAFVVYAPRVRGMAILRPLKALVIVVLAYWPYWALSTVTFHYVFGVDVWSHALWADIAAVWNSGGNLRWSAFWLLVADTMCWYVLLVFVWARVARVWVAVKRWGVRIVQWIIRASVFTILTYTVIRFMGFGLWQTVDQLASALAAFPYGAETVAKAPQWAVAFVLLVFGLVLLNLIIIVLETITDAICFVSKMFNIVLHGGILNADKYDDENLQPKRIIGLFERFDRYQHRVAVRYEAYARQQLVNEMTSGITDDGFQESLDDDKPPEPAPRPRRARRRWWPWGGIAPAAAEDAAEVAATGEAAVATAPAGGAGGDPVPQGSSDLEIRIWRPKTPWMSCRSGRPTRPLAIRSWRPIRRRATSRKVAQRTASPLRTTCPKRPMPTTRSRRSMRHERRSSASARMRWRVIRTRSTKRGNKLVRKRISHATRTGKGSTFCRGASRRTRRIRSIPIRSITRWGATPSTRTSPVSPKRRAGRSEHRSGKTMAQSLGPNKRTPWRTLPAVATGYRKRRKTFRPKQ